MHLEDFVVDLGNLVAFRKRSREGLMHWVVRSKRNDRTRGRLSNRKPFD